MHVRERRAPNWGDSAASYRPPVLVFLATSVSVSAARSSMRSAISRSPSTTRLAPSRSRCSTAASEWARARMSSEGIGLARLLHHLAGLEGLGNGDEQPPCRFEVGRGEDLRVGGIADEHLGAVAARSSRGRPRWSRSPPSCAPSRRKRGADQRADPAVADQHIVAGLLAGVGVGDHFLAASASGAASGCGRRTSRAKTSGIEHDRDDGAAQDQVARQRRHQLELDARGRSG